MKNPFKKEILSYKGDVAITPYQRAQQEWDLRIGSARAQAKNWRILAILSLLVVILLLVALLICLAFDHLLYILQQLQQKESSNHKW